jgi:hypothetical protein
MWFYNHPLVQALICLRIMKIEVISFAMRSGN